MSELSITSLNRILERDATDTTYKFALLRAVSYVCQRYSHYLRKEDNRVWLPTGLLVERWLSYYYPIIESDVFIPQKNAERELSQPGLKMSFRGLFKEVTNFYADKNGFSAFWIDYKKGTMPREINLICLELVKRIWYTIIRFPMKHLGYSVSQKHYSIFHFTKRRTIRKGTRLSQELLINSFGEFSMSTDFYNTLLLFGSYISGEYSILNKWIDFSVNADPTRTIQPNKVFEVLNVQPESERDVQESKDFFFNRLQEEGQLECVWSGNAIVSKSNLHIDHLIPFSLWQNNDIWNLLPSHKRVNAQKHDLVPSLSLLERRRGVIIDYWHALKEHYPHRFQRETRISLTGNKPIDDSLDTVFNQLKENCRYLIEVRGLSEWTL